MKKTFRSVYALAIVLVGATLAHAQAPKPVLVFTIPSYDDVLANVDFFGKLGGQPGARQMIEGMLQGFTRGQGLKGLDKTKPIGVMVTASSEELNPLLFLPVTSAKDYVDTMGALGVMGTDEGAGVWRFNLQGQEVFLHDRTGWAYVTKTKNAALPDDPLAALGGLNTQYDVGLRIYLQNVPADLKKKGMDQFRGLMEFAAAQQQMQGDPFAALSRKNMQQQIKMLERMLNEADQFTMGWKVDRPAKNTHLDFTFTAQPGTQLAQEMQKLADSRTKFSGFLMPEAAVTFGGSGQTSQENIEQTLATLEQVKQKAEQAIANDANLPDDNTRAQVKAVLNQLLTVAEKTVRTGKSDVAGAVMLAPGQFQVAVGCFLADSASLEGAVKNLVELAKGEPKFKEVATVKFDLETFKGIRFHQVNIAVPQHEDEARKVLGDSLELYLGFGPDSLYFAMGKDSLQAVKSAIDRSAAAGEKAVQPLQLSIDLEAIFKFAASMNPGDPKLGMFVQAMQATAGKNHITLNARAIPNGMTYRLNVEDGILEAFGQMSKMAMGMRGGPGGPGGGAPAGGF